MQHIYIYVDDSGVFAKKYNNFFVYAGYMFCSKKEKDYAQNRYKLVESRIKQNLNLPDEEELKAANNAPAIKYQLFRSMNQFERFGALINLSKIHTNIIEGNKRTKQRYKDYALCRAIKYGLEQLEKSGKISFIKAYYFHIYVDEQSVATNGKYNLRDTIEAELFVGKHTEVGSFIPPLFGTSGKMELAYKDSKYNALVRASDIVANKLFVFNSQVPAQRVEFPFINLP